MPEDFDPAVLGQPDIASKADAERTMADLFVKRWWDLREQVQLCLLNHCWAGLRIAYSVGAVTAASACLRIQCQAVLLSSSAYTDAAAGTFSDGASARHRHFLCLGKETTAAAGDVCCCYP